MDPALGTFYRLDEQDRIVEIGGAWDAFALKNDGSELLQKRVVGTSLFSHITGKSTRECLRMTFESVRWLGRGCAKPYRCDSPTLKRFMEMRLTPNPSSRLLLEHVLIRTEPIKEPVSFVATRTAIGLSGVRCSFCNRVRARGQEDWQEPEAHANDLLSETKAPAKIIYGVCPPCRERYARPGR